MYSDLDMIIKNDVIFIFTSKWYDSIDIYSELICYVLIQNISEYKRILHALCEGENPFIQEIGHGGVHHAKIFR